MKRHIPLVSFLPLLAACSSGQEVDVSLYDACGLDQKAAYTEFAVFNGCDAAAPKCGRLDQLAVGDVSGARFHALVPQGGALPPIGKLEPESYAFAAVVRNAACEVVAFDCVCADLASVGKIALTPAAYSAECPDSNACGSDVLCALKGRGGCQEGFECQAGTCGQKQDPDPDPDPKPKTCELRVVAQGALPDVTEPARFTGPALAATDSGFVLAYRTQLSAAGALGATVTPLSADGALGVAATQSLGGCATTQPTDGVGLAFAAGRGLAAFSVPGCGVGTGGAVFAELGAGGAVTSWVPGQPQPAYGLTLAPSGALAPRPGANRFDFAYVDGDQALTEERNGAALASNPTPVLEEGAAFAMVAGGKAIRAWLAAAASGAVGIKVGAATAAPDTLAPVSLGSASWADVAAGADSVAVLLGLPSGARSLRVTADGALHDDTTLGSGALGAGRVAWLGESPLVVMSRADALEVRWLAADVKPVTLTSGAVPTLAGFDGVQLALAASGKRAVAAWLKQGEQTTGAPGGYAVLECIVPE